MGLCISTKKSTKTTPAPPPPPLKPHNHLQDRTLVPESDPPLSETNTITNNKKKIPFIPSPPPLEEESVKEVLSETPTVPRPAPPSYLKYPKQLQQQKILRLPSFPRIEEPNNNNNNNNKTTPPSFEEISEVSDICSVSESVSTSALTEHSREFEEVGQYSQPRIIDRSPSKIRRKRSDSYSGDQFYGGRGESPIRRTLDHQWLGGRNNQNDIPAAAAGKLMYGKEVGQMLRHNKNLTPPNGRDQGESSRRRSRSPVTRVDSGLTGGVSRSPSGKRIVRSSGRSPVTSSESGRNLEEAKEGKRPVSESLEDPMVSLECFIFL